MRPIRLTILLVSLAFSAFSQQEVLLLAEDFEGPLGNNTFGFDTGGITNHFGSNKWIVNNQYDGGTLYPLTTSQDSTEAGNINNAPYSTYMHIHDQNAVGSGVANTNYDPANASDRFAYTSFGFCTRGLTNVTVAFFYLCEGGPGAYGELYYSVNGGNWVSGGQYANQTKWKYVSLTNAAFQNVQDLRIGFRWINSASTPNPAMSFAVDDILVVGTYDTTITTTPRLTISDVTNPVCREGILLWDWELSAPLCDGTYRLELSDINGQFSANPFNFGQTNFIGPNQTSGTLARIIPAGIGAGTCYRVRMVRVTPPPMIISNESECIVIQTCPNRITTLQPLIVTDVDTACVQSVITVPFYSTGAYNNGNFYVAQISDSSGSFATFTEINRNRDNVTYDPATGSDPGNVGGLIPVVPEGCNYYVRVVSTNPPATILDPYGPFCLKHCDITTNEKESISVCIYEDVGATDTIEIDINQLGQVAEYLDSNRFIVQLLDKMTLSIVNEGALGVIKDTSSTKLILVIPGLTDLLALGVAPDFYYMRIIADSSTTPWNANGTVVTLTIGVIRNSAPILTPEKTVYCNTEIAQIFVSPFQHPPFDYEWLSPGINQGAPFEWEFNPLRVDLDGSQPGPMSFRVREINFGCVGPFSNPANIFVTTSPDVNIVGLPQVCQGDTFFYQVTFLPETYYEWSLPWGNMIDTSNNEIYVIFDSSGTVDIGLYALNACGPQSSTYRVNVVKTLGIETEGGTTICAGESVQLKGTGAGFDKTLTTLMSGAIGTVRHHGAMFDVMADHDAIITGLDANFASTTPAPVKVYYRPGPHAGAETDSTAWLFLGSALVTPNPVGIPTPIPVPMNIPMQTGETFSFYVTTTNNSMLVMNSGIARDTLYKTDGVLNFYEGTGLTYPFTVPFAPRIWNGRIHYFTEHGVGYLWSNGDSTAIITVSPQVSTDYILRVTDSTGCGSTDKVSVLVNPLPDIETNRFDTLLCRGLEIQLNATGDADTYQWAGDGLSNPNISNPTVVLTESKEYLVKGTISATGCASYDTVRVLVEGCELTLNIPQAFTPNGDQVNDYFTVFGDNIDRYEIRIFNRWGEQVYYSTNVSELSQGNLMLGWNGEHKGKPQDTGVYVYHVKVSFGALPPVERKGNLTLIR